MKSAMIPTGLGDGVIKPMYAGWPMWVQQGSSLFSSSCKTLSAELGSCGRGQQTGGAIRACLGR
jgi:hypothetical protein